MKSNSAGTMAIITMAIGLLVFTFYTKTHQPTVQGAAVRPLPATAPGRIGPENLYPIQALTPGTADTLELAKLTATYSDNCPSGKTTCTYSQDHRNVPTREHGQVYTEYKVPIGKRNIKSGEVDHFYPLCAGGSNEITNLWYQPAINQWNGKDFGYHAKDKLEAYICIQIKAGKLDPKDAFQRITIDWVKLYLDLGSELDKVESSNASVQ